MGSGIQQTPVIFVIKSYIVISEISCFRTIAYENINFVFVCFVSRLFFSVIISIIKTCEKFFQLFFCNFYLFDLFIAEEIFAERFIFS